MELRDESLICARLLQVRVRAFRLSRILKKPLKIKEAGLRGRPLTQPTKSLVLPGLNRGRI